MLGREGRAILEQEILPAADDESKSITKMECGEESWREGVRVTVSRRPAEDNEYIDAGNM
jgi:hypothetical protein